MTRELTGLQKAGGCPEEFEGRAIHCGGIVLSPQKIASEFGQHSLRLRASVGGSSRNDLFDRKLPNSFRHEGGDACLNAFAIGGEDKAASASTARF